MQKSMNTTQYKPVTRIHKEKVVLANGQFARWLSRRTGASHTALSTALQLIGNGIVDALAEGYQFQWLRLGTFETRELEPRMRYNRVKKAKYMSRPSTIVHFRKAQGLNDTVRARAAKAMQDQIMNPTAKPAERK